MSRSVDLVVVGGGINGAAVARDAAGRGMSVYLAERHDYAAGTSSASSKLIHGGLRYLEHREFRLVREALHERRTLMRIAPHLVHPQRFLLPVTCNSPRPTWLLRTGLWLYDRLGGREGFEPSGRLTPAAVRRLAGLRTDGLRAVLHYPDCRTDDARLTLETVLDARRHGADVGNRRSVTAITAQADGYRVTVEQPGGTEQIQASFVVNAAGPWAGDLLARMHPAGHGRPLRLVRGSHLIVPAPDDDRKDAYTLQAADGRVVFVLPWLDDFRIIGTTEVTQATATRFPECTQAERDYLIDSYNAFFRPALAPGDVCWSYAGVRPLVDDRSTDASRVSRGYAIDAVPHAAGGLITIYGGKLTTHRVLAERVMDRIAALGRALPGAWTRERPLPGGELSRSDLAAAVECGPDSIDPTTRARWAATYGSRIRVLYERLARRPGAARQIAPGVPVVELEHAVEDEDADTAEDFLHRRTQLFLQLDARGREAVNEWFAGRTTVATAAGSRS